MTGRIRRFEPPSRWAPRDGDYVEHVTEDGRRVFVHLQVLADLERLERLEHPRETAGLLFGRAFTDGARQCALVRHLILPEPGEVSGTVATVTITAEGSSRMSERAQRWHPCADPVGWAHTHPTFEAYFSEVDRAEQAIWTSPASVGLVMSGLSRARRAYEVFVGPASAATQVAGPVRWQPSAGPEAAVGRPLSGPGDRQPRIPVHPRRPGQPLPPRRPDRFLLLAIAALLAYVLVLLLALGLGGGGSARSTRSAAGNGPAAATPPPLQPEPGGTIGIGGAGAFGSGGLGVFGESGPGR